MEEHDPSNFNWITYAWVFGLSAMGGVVAFMQKLKDGHARVFNLVEFVGEIVTSAFTGVITFYLCESAHLDRILTAALVGVAGHMGSRALYFIEHALAKRFKNGAPE
jgi:hypothetical protein